VHQAWVEHSFLNHESYEFDEFFLGRYSILNHGKLNTEVLGLTVQIFDREICEMREVDVG